MAGRVCGKLLHAGLREDPFHPAGAELLDGKVENGRLHMRRCVPGQPGRGDEVLVPL